MGAVLSQLTDLFKGKVNQLIVDDDRHVLKTLGCYFSSAAFKVTFLDNFTYAMAAVATGTWHCWLLDIDLGDGRTGLEIMHAQPSFPFIIVLSGLQSMRVASEAVRQGAMEVFDKDPHVFDRLFDATCRTVACGNTKTSPTST
jgi:ActR/RegA family two-component response regulator